MALDLLTARTVELHGLRHLDRLTAGGTKSGAVRLLRAAIDTEHGCPPSFWTQKSPAQTGLFSAQKSKMAGRESPSRP